MSGRDGDDKPSNANEHCPGTRSKDAGTSSSCEGCPNQKICASGEANRPDPVMDLIRKRLQSVKHKIVVLSGKGGVGKSTTSSQLAFGLAAKGFQVGLLDIDICGPSIPRMLGLYGESVHRSASGWSPVYVDDNLGVMSIGFMLPEPDAAVIWRGPRKNALIKQFLSDVDWGTLDFLIIDTPPGTSDEHITAVQALNEVGVDGAVIVTTPQEIAMMDVRKELAFCKKTSLRVLGVIENMSTTYLPVNEMVFVGDDGEDQTQHVRKLLETHVPEILRMRVVTDMFPKANGGAEAMAKRYRVPFLGRIPLDPMLLRCGETGRSIDAVESGRDADEMDVDEEKIDRVKASATAVAVSTIVAAVQKAVNETSPPPL